jgi:uncharacterized protein (DUF433 family)
MSEATPHVELQSGPRGVRPRIAGKGILVQAVVAWHQMGLTPDEIAANHDLTLAEVYAALSYYYDHRVEIDRLTREDREYVEQMKQRNPSLVQEKLKKRFAV